MLFRCEAMMLHRCALMRRYCASRTQRNLPYADSISAIECDAQHGTRTWLPTDVTYYCHTQARSHPACTARHHPDLIVLPNGKVERKRTAQTSDSEV